MDERIKGVVRALIPAKVLRPIINRFFRIRWVGDYASWAKAARHSRGYAQAVILQRVVAATRLARDGVAAFERDGIAFADPEVNRHLLAGLQLAVPAGGGLSLLDFGGALGSVYWQHRAWLRTLPDVRWRVVEQAHFVESGRAEFTDDRLRFYASIEECFEHERPDVLLLAGVLPYLAEPHALLEKVSKLGFGHILLDRTGIIDRPADRLTVQHVPGRLYRASYPCWFLNQQRLLAHFSSGYELVREYTNEDGSGSGVLFRGFHLKRRTHV